MNLHDDLKHWEGDEEAGDLLDRALWVAKDAVSRSITDKFLIEGLTPARYSVFVNMAFNGGAGIFYEFPRFVEAVKSGRWDLAARELRYKHWKAGKNLDETALYAGHPARWDEMCRRLVSGEFEEENG